MRDLEEQLVKGRRKNESDLGGRSPSKLKAEIEEMEKTVLSKLKGALHVMDWAGFADIAESWWPLQDKLEKEKLEELDQEELLDILGKATHTAYGLNAGYAQSMERHKIVKAALDKQ